MMGTERLRQWLPDDPGFAALRRATRAALVVPATLAFAKLVIGDSQTTTFVSFGCFALLVMADFGGPRQARTAAYLTTIMVGVVLISLGTLASPVAWVAMLAMLLVGFWIQFVGVFGSYIAAAQTALQLSFLLAVSVPAPASALGGRLIGWLLAGFVSTLAGVFVWPRFERLALRREAAQACRALAALIDARRARSDTPDLSRRQETARAAVEAARRDYAATPQRPAGPIRRDRAFVELLSELQPTLDIATRPFGSSDAIRTSSPVRPCIVEADNLAAATVQTLEGSADVLTGGTSPDLLALDRARLSHRQALDRWAATALTGGRAPDDVLAGLDADHWLRVVAYLALAIGSNAVIAAGEQVGDGLNLPAGTPLEGRSRPLIRIARTISTHLVPTSSVLHHSLRVGIGLALAVFLARTLAVSHSFWVVLGTLTVLRSNAFGTGRTTVEALIGTVAGFAIGALFTATVGASSQALWLALPITVFLATYAASAIGFVVGQAGFTVLVIILFNVISPVGWRVGLARVEDVALGVGISVVVGLLLWPRGARGELVRAVGGLHRASVGFLSRCFIHLLDGGSRQDAVANRTLAVRARDRAGEAFDLYLYERGAKPLDPERAAFLIDAGTRAILAGDLLIQVADMGYQVQDSFGAVAPLRPQIQLLLAEYLHLADRLDGTSSALLPWAGMSDATLRETALSALRDWQRDSERGRTAMAVVIAGEWIQHLSELTRELQSPTDEAVKAAHLPWWH